MSGQVPRADPVEAEGGAGNQPDEDHGAGTSGQSGQEDRAHAEEDAAQIENEHGLAMVEPQEEQAVMQMVRVRRKDGLLAIPAPHDRQEAVSAKGTASARKGTERVRAAWPFKAPATVMKPSRNPRKCAPPSPMKVRAGWKLKGKKPRAQPMVSRHSRATKGR